ncbi:TolC family protein [Terriglobus roseus]|uniref:Outer membrane protein, cobalt-zinc-cadmium efflux system n=1 Tax=Terriglobus roseus TaxID=392734 RepID=A0A1H4IUT1_9BACT|nr:TolC family protein [Terriglobus roseus]SEB37757.1 outer membrane protein, cobalt-zinc-cadmium efflux system [Terriglobus roseus]
MRSLLLTGSLLLQAVAFAQTVAPSPPTASGQPLTMAQAVDYARLHSPGLQGAQTHVSAVQALEITAGLRLNPIIAGEGTQSTLSTSDPNGPPFYGIGLQRTFETGGKRGLRLDAARANTGVASAQFDDQRRSLDFNVRSAFTKMLQAKLALAIANDNLTGYRRTVELMKVRLDAGDVDRTDFERIELQLAGFENDQTNAQLNLTQASEQLQVLLGEPHGVANFDIVGTLDLPQLSSTEKQLEDAAIAARPDLLAASRQVRANEAAIRLADANGKTDPQFGLEYEHSGTGSTAGFNLSIPLRIFDKNQGEKERSRREAESSRLLLQQQVNQVISDVDQAYAAYQAAVAQNARYQTKYLAEAAHVRDNLEFAYRNGDATLLDYLSALQDYRQTNLAALNAQATAQTALHQLSYATATEVNP